MIFSESTNTQAYLKAGFMGFAGSGKTYTATMVAIGLWKELAARKLPGGSAPIFFLDTETGSDWVARTVKENGITLFAGKTRAFANLIPAIREAEQAKGILIIDSITHFWQELTESYAKKRHRTRGLEFQDWAYLKGPAAWGNFTDVFINSNCHILMCGRAGHTYDFFENEDGKKELQKTGVKMKAEAETGYEPSILVLMARHQDITCDPIKVWRTATVLKDRADLIDGKQFKNPSFADFKPHVDYLNLGGDQLGVDTSVNSEGMIAPIDNQWRNDRAERETILDEIKELLLKHHPSASAADKKAKADALESASGTRSWARLEILSLNDVRGAYNMLLAFFSGPNEDDKLPDFGGTEPVEI
jgi:hypothetical protein